MLLKLGALRKDRFEQKDLQNESLSFHRESRAIEKSGKKCYNNLKQ